MKNNLALSGPIVSTFCFYVVPSIIGLIAITTANLVDGIFVGNAVGPHALAAITLQIPYFTLLIAIALMLAIGGSVRAGKYVGEGNLEAASAIFSKTLIVALAVNTIFAITSLFFEETLFRLLNAPESIQPLINEYFSVIRWVLVIQLVTMVLYYFVRADGHPVLATKALVIGAVLNIALDAWFIIGLQMGLQGAAYATAIAQLIQFAILASYFYSPHRTLQLKLKQNNWKEVLSAAYNGLSEFINEISVGAIFLLLNGLLISNIGINGVAAFSVVNYFIFISVMLCYGIADALHLLVSQNYGAQHIARIRYFLITALASAFLLGCLLITGLLFWKEHVISWFVDTKSSEVTHLAVQLLLLIWPLFLVNGVNIILSCYLTAIHQPQPSALISICRSLILPAVFLSGFYWLLSNNYAVFPDQESWSFLAALPIAEWCTFFIAAVLFYRYRPSLLAHS